MSTWGWLQKHPYTTGKMFTAWSINLSLKNSCVYVLSVGVGVTCPSWFIKNLRLCIIWRIADIFTSLEVLPWLNLFSVTRLIWSWFEIAFLHDTAVDGTEKSPPNRSCHLGLFGFCYITLEWHAGKNPKATCKPVPRLLRDKSFCTRGSHMGTRPHKKTLS